MKLYVQLRPDSDGIALVRSVQQSLHTQSRIIIVKQSAIHLTILHIGAVDRMLDSMAGFTTMNRREILLRVDKLIKDLEAATADIGDIPFKLEPIAYERFGTHGTAYAITFQPTAELNTLHDKCLLVLKKFFASCNITDTEAFMTADDNFKHALSLRPHVTVAKGTDIADPIVKLQPVSFKLMAIVYDM